MAAEGHKLLEHKAGECREEGSCNICDGGLALCTVCGGAEGSLPSNCPGRRMTDAEEAQVYSGHLDFVVFEGETRGVWLWHKLPKPLNKADRAALFWDVKEARKGIQ